MEKIPVEVESKQKSDRDPFNPEMKIIKMKSPSETELKQNVESMKCKSCRNYTFYHCSALNITTGPEATCQKNDKNSPYSTREGYVVA